MKFAHFPPLRQELGVHEAGAGGTSVIGGSTIEQRFGLESLGVTNELLFPSTTFLNKNIRNRIIFILLTSRILVSYLVGLIGNLLARVNYVPDAECCNTVSEIFMLGK